MSKFQNDKTKVVVSVSDEKDDRFASGWTPVDSDGNPVEVKRSPGRPKKTEE